MNSISNNQALVSSDNVQSPGRAFAPHIGEPSAGVNHIAIEAPNFLLRAATPLLTLITQIKHTADQHEVVKFRAQVVEEVNLFTRNAQESQYPKAIVLAARYCVCTAIDEAVLGQPWGAKSLWLSEGLLSYFHKETWGGERFYIIIENLAKDSRRNIDFLEFAYAVLSLGFEGKYFDKHAPAREVIRNRLFYRIRNARNKPDRLLSRLLGSELVSGEKINKKKVIKNLSIFTVITLVVVNIFFNVLTYNHAKPVLNKLDNIATVSPVTEFSQLISRPVIKRGEAQ